MIIYTDGGCSGNDQRDLSKRKMVMVATDELGNVLVEKTEEGGSNNIAELYAIKEALMECKSWEFPPKEVIIRTDSRNNLAWVYGKIGRKINDRAKVLLLRNTIDALKKEFTVALAWIPREENLAGHYIEEKYGL